jgi:trigger factor
VDIAKVDENNLEIEYDFEKYPDITLGDYKNIKTKYKKPAISTEEIQKEIDHMIQKDIMLTPKDQDQIAHGDMVNFDFDGSVDGKPFEGGKSAGYELEIGSNMFIPGFELQMIGLKAGDTKDIKVTFPKDYHAKEMANKEATFKLKINSVKTINKPELDEAYIARFAIPNVKTKQELHAYLEHNIFEHKNYQLRQEAIKIISQHIIDNCKLEFIPNSLLKSEIERLNEDTNKRAEQAKKTLDEFIATSLGFKTRAMYDANVEEVASKNLTLVIAIEKIITELKLTITQDEIDDHINKIAKVYNISIEDVKNRMNNNFDGIKTFLLQEKVFDKLIEMNSDK